MLTPKNTNLQKDQNEEKTDKRLDEMKKIIRCP